MTELAKLFYWTIAFQNNVSPQGREFTAGEVVTAINHFKNGIDPYESAAAICEGREPYHDPNASNADWWHQPMEGNGDVKR